MITVMHPKKLVRILHTAGIGLLFNSAALADGLPDLAPLALQVPDPLTAPPNPMVSIVWGVTNQGAGPALGYPLDALFLSSTPVLDGSATYLATFTEYSSMSAGESYWATNQLQLPLMQSGQFYLIFKADYLNNVAESDENNNLLAVPFKFDSSPADLIPVQLLVPQDITGPPSPSVTVAWQIANQGIGPALNSWRDGLYLSTNTVVDYTAQSLGQWQESGPIEVGNNYWLTNTLRIPVTQSGDYYLIIKTDDGNWLEESDPFNNELAVPVRFTIQPPDLVPVALLAPPSVTAPPYPSVTLVWCVTNQGIGAAIGFPSWTDQVLFSTNNSPGSAVSLSSWYETGPVPVGGSYWRTNTVHLPITQSGTAYLFLKADAKDNLVELDNNNNLISVPLVCTITPSDLLPITSQVPAVITGPPNPILSLAWGVTNRGIGAALGDWVDNVYFSTDPVLDWQDASISHFYYHPPLPPGAAYWQTNMAQLPAVSSGTYYLIFRVDSYNDIFESDESNNVVVVPVTINILPPDLVPLLPTTSLALTASPRPNLTLTWGVTNQGIGPAIGNWYWVDTVYFSPDPVLDSSDQWMTYNSQPGPIPPGGSYWWTNTLSLPVVQSGTYYLLFKTDAYNSVYESDESNNLVVVPITYEILQPDLVPIAFQTPSTVISPPNPTVSFAFGITNQGPGVASASGGWPDQLWLCTNAAPDGTETFLTSLGHQDPLGPAQSYWVTNSIRVPVTSSGSYFLMLKTDPFNEAYESNTNNNFVAVPIAFTILPPDLAPVVLQVPGNITGPPYPSVTFTWAVTNQGIGAAIGYDYWYDSLYISTNAVFDASAVFVTGLSEGGPIAPGSAYWRTNTAHLPVEKSGGYYFLFVTDAGNQLFESNESNNVVVVPATLNIQPPDLVPTLEAPAVVTAPPNPSVRIAWGVTNQGIGVAIPYPYYYFVDRIYFSHYAVLDPRATGLSSSYGPGSLDAAAGYGGSTQVRVPMTQSGTGYLIFQTDADHALFEANENNNLAIVQVTFNIQPADLAPLALSVPSLVAGPPNSKLLFSWGVTNQGIGAAMPGWQDRLYFSSKATLDSTATAIYTSSEWNSVPPGTAYWRTNVARAPVTSSGTYYFILTTDADNSLYESNFVNNTLAVPVTLHIDPPDLAPVLLSAPGAVTGPPNPTLTFSYAVTNQGEGVAIGSDSWVDRAFISIQPVLEGSEIPLTSVGYGQSWVETGPVAAHRTYWRTRTVQVPVVTNGDYYLIFKANAGGELFESNVTNNLLVAPIAFNVQSPDLTPITLLAPSFVSGGPNPTVTLVWGVTNQGAGPATLDRYWQDVVYLSSDTTIHAGDPCVATVSESGPVAPGGSYWRTNTLSISVKDSGTYYLILKLNDGNSLSESDGSNNVAIAPIKFIIALPDLTPLALRTPTELTGPAYPAVTLVWGVTNQGTGPAQSSYSYSGAWVDQIYLSTNPVLDGADVGISYVYYPAPLPATGSYWQTNQVRLPLTQSGDYYLILRTDDYGYLQEANRSNNVLTVTLTFHMTPPDLAALALRAPGTVSGPRNPTITLAWGVTNLGVGAAEGYYGWSDTVFLSMKAIRDGTEQYVGQWVETDALPAGSGYWRTNQAQLPVTQSGAYYLIFETDSYNELVESNFSNNVLSMPITIQVNPPDLAPVALQAPLSVTSAPYPTLKLVWGVTNQGVGAISAPADWYDLICLTTNEVLPDPWSRTTIGYSHETNSLAAGGSYWRTNEIQVPVTQSGAYYLWLVVDANSQAFEANYANNSLRLPINLQLQAPDLAPTTLLVPDSVTGTPCPSVSVVIGVTNQGIGPALGSRRWTDYLYLSSTPFLDQGSTIVVSWPHTNDVPDGGSYWLTNNVRMPVIDSASYYLFFVTDYGNNLLESNADNNSLMTTVSFELAPPSDLAPTDFFVPPVVTGSGDGPVTVAWRVANLGLGPAAGAWHDTIYLASAPNQFWYYWTLLTVTETNSLPAGSGYWQTNTVNLASLDNGNYYLILEANSSREWFETDWDNNRLAAPIRVSFGAPATPRITGGRFLADGTFELAVTGQVGTDYVLQASADLASWVNLTTFICDALPTYVRDLQAGSFPRRFYRVASTALIIPPALTISSTTSNAVVVSWPLTAGGWVLEQSATLTGSPPLWAQVQSPYQTNANQAWITLSPASGNQFYRLRRP
jgi:subtilase family serine protease